MVTYNENLFQGQLQGLTSNLNKTRQRLAEIQSMLRRRREGRVRGGKAPTVASVKHQVQQALSRQWMKGLFICEVSEEGGLPALSYRTDAAALGRFMRNTWARRSSSPTTTTGPAQIVLAYRSQFHIEHAFRDMKHPHYLGWSPMFHWTDSKIRVHAFTCVLALTLTSLLQRTLHHKGIDLSMPRMYDLLGSIRETLVIYPKKQGQRHPSTARTLSTLNAEQEGLLTILNLRRYL